MKPSHLLAAMLLLFYVHASAQDILPAKRIDLMMEVAPNDVSLTSTDTTFSSTTSVITKVIIVLQDTANLSKIHVKLGSTSGANNLLAKDFIYTTPGTYSDGTSYARSGNVLYLNLGTRLGLQNCFAEIKLEDTFGRITAPVNLSGN